MVPDSAVAIRPREDGKDIDPAGVSFVCDPFDEIGIAQAIHLQETRRDVRETVALAIGPVGAREALWTAIGMGVGRGVHVCDAGLDTRDELFLARVVAAAAVRAGAERFDLILCGKQSIDNDAGEFGPALAECLDWPHVGAATQLELSDDGTRLTARRSGESADEIIECSLPAVVTCDRGLAEPRYVALTRLMRAKRSPIQVLTLAELGVLCGSDAACAVVSLDPPRPRPPCRMIEGSPQAIATRLVELLRHEARVL
jgi:electron transfer flavoprotein beta subunit